LISGKPTIKKRQIGVLSGLPLFVVLPVSLIIQHIQVISTMNLEIMLNAVTSTPNLYKDATTLFGTLKNMMQSLANK
jgi:hypothetical protein